MLWDFVEANVISGATRDWFNAVEGCLKAIGSVDSEIREGQSGQANATVHPLPDDSAQFFCSDPPYYDAVPYADLSDFFYVWLKRSLPPKVRMTFSEELTPKQNECIVDEVKGKDRQYFETTMAKAMAEACRVLAPEGIGLVVFAHKSTSGWEAQLQAMVEAGWTMTGSWPIDTEMGSRLRAKDSAALASSIHLVCRPRENPDGSLRADIGDWRDVLQELPPRIHAWMPRLAKEGVVGADAIFACLGPALEIFSRYSRVEKSNGEAVTLREYLEQVWGAVSKEALGMIFDDADTSGFEEDARLTAMWLWTLSAGAGEAGAGAEIDGEAMEDEGGERSPKAAKTSGYTLEYDTARKIAQGLGVHLDKLTTLVEVKGDKATLLAVSRRALSLFGKTEAKTPSDRRQAKAAGKQLNLFATPTAAELGAVFDMSDPGVPKVGSTVLDRLHQTMILFSAGRSEALKSFLVTDGIGKDPRYWQLAQALSALYPRGSEEKRWVDGVLARKKGLGF